MSKMLCVSEVVDTEDGEMLQISVPWNREMLKTALDNCDPDKNSVTLVNGDIVGQISGRQALSMIVDIGPYTVELRGGINIYVSRPKSAGKTTAARNYEKQMVAETALAQAAEEAKWVELPTALLNRDQAIVRQQGDRILKATLGEMLLDGYSLMPQTAE